MINVKDAKYKDVMENKIDPSTYNYDTVRYVRVKLNDGSYNWDIRFQKQQLWEQTFICLLNLKD